MITITITKTTRNTWAEKANLVKTETPTAQRTKYDEVIYAKEYVIGEVTKSEDKTVTLLQQNILNDEELDLAAVIVAINKLG